MFHSLAERSHEPELMDLPDSDELRLLRTVRQFGLINSLLTRSKALLKQHVVRDMLRRPQNCFSLLDLGSGGCDIGRWLARYVARNSKKQLRVTCLDHDSRVYSYARAKCADTPGVEVVLGSARDLDRLPRYDYIFANHFLHHLTNDRLTGMLELICRRARYLFIINDLLRSPLSYVGYSLFAAAFLHRSFAGYDGKLSIRKGFLPDELRALLTGISCVWAIKVQTRFPGRVFLVGRRRRTQ